jgi:hypothetical protein
MSHTRKSDRIDRMKKDSSPLQGEAGRSVSTAEKKFDV